jgi:hypothetical protein
MDPLVNLYFGSKSVYLARVSGDAVGLHADDLTLLKQNNKEETSSDIVAPSLPAGQYAPLSDLKLSHVRDF